MASQLDQKPPDLASPVAAATAAKSLQLCPTLCDPTDVSPPGSPAPGTLQARVLEWGAIAFSTRAAKCGQMTKPLLTECKQR